MGPEVGSGDRKPNAPLRLRVMADYGSSGIWVIGQIGPFRHGMIKHRSLGLSAELARRFDEWIDEYTSRLDPSRGALDVAAFNAKGRALAKDLKRFLGPE